MRIEEIDVEATLELRQQVLWPNETKKFCRVDGDDQATHYGAFLHHSLIGVASIYQGAGAVRLRKFAVDKQYQGKGVGSAMLTHIIDSLKNANATIFWCDARESAADFYERFGFSVEGESFYKADIPYRKMVLDLRN